jgi:hypothetical protein
MSEALKTVSGQVISIDHGTHSITVKDEAGENHTFMWTAGFEERMNKLKLWYFTKITAEKLGDYWKVSSQEFFAKPATWKGSGTSSGGKYQPRNEKLICFLALHRDACTLASSRAQSDFEHIAKMVYDQAKADTEQAMKDFGG